MSDQPHDRAFLVSLWTLERRPELSGARATLLCRVLARSRPRLGFRLHAYVVLPRAAHLVLGTPDGDPRSVAVIVHRIRARFARELHTRHGWPGRFFRDESRLAPMEGAAAIARRALHLHRLPVRAGLASHPADWPWSSYGAWSGRGVAPVPVDPPPVRDRPAGALPAVSG